MHVARVQIFALLLSCLVVSPAWAQDGPPGLTTVDGNVDASMSLSSDGGTYMYFNKWVGDGVGAPNSYQQFGFRANLFDFDEYGSHLFTETHLFISDHSRTGVNLGGGLRWEYDGGFAGINGFFDEIDTVAGNTYRQATVGAEYRHDGLDIFANGYFLLSDDNSNLVAVTDPFGPAFFQGNNIFTLGTGLVERAYEGFDFEAGVPIPGLDPIRIYAGTYWMTDDADDEVWGVRSRAEARVGQGTKLNFVVSDDEAWGTNINFQAEFMFWGESPMRMPVDYSAFSRRHDPVRRTSVVHTNIAEEPTPVILTNPRTNLPWIAFHVDNTNVGGVTGTWEDPSEVLPPGAASDLILVNVGVGDTIGNVTLIDFQQLLGEGFAHFIDTVEVGNIQLPPDFLDAGPHPTLRPLVAGDPIVTLANDNRVVALNMIGSTNAAIRGTDVDNFFIQRVFADSTNGISISNASGLGTIVDSTFDANGAGTGIFVQAAGGGPLTLDIDDVDNTGGARGFDIVANGSDVTLTADNITGDNHSNAGFRIAADASVLTADVNNADMTDSGRGFVQDVSNGGSIDSEFFNILATGTGNLFEGKVVAGGNLDTQVIDGIFNGSTAGHGIALDLQGATGLASFTSISANGNGIDGLNAIADAGSVYDISVTNSTAILNTDDSIDITSIGTSFVDFFYDPSDSSNNGDNGFEFLVDGGSRLDAEFIDIDLSDNGNNAVFGETLGGSTTNLDFVRVDMDDSDTGNGLELSVDGASRLVGSFVDSSVRSTDSDDNINLTVTDGSDVDLDFTDTPADASGDNGLVFFVDDGANGISTLDIHVTNGTFNDNPSTNIAGTILDGSEVVFDFTNVTADNLAPTGGGLNITATDGSSFVSTWDGGSISNTLDDGVQAIGLGAGVGTTIDMTFTDVTIDGNADNGINWFSSGPDGIANLSLTNSPVTNNGIHGVTADLFDTTGTFSATDSPFTGNGTSGAGSGFRMFADTDSVMTANFDNSDANDNATHGYHFNMATNSTINSVFAGNTATATNNGENGLNFEVLSGSTYNLALTGGDFSDNGQNVASSGVRGFVDGSPGIDVSRADVSFDGTLSNNNTLHGFEFLVSDGAFFAGRLNTTGANGILSASNNANSGVRFTADDAGTVAGILSVGDNLFNDNGALTFADGIEADGIGVARFVVGVTGSFNNNGGDGVDVFMDTVTTASVDIDGSTTGTVNDNFDDGIDINLVDTTLNSQVFDGTGTPAFSIAGFAGINDNGANGVEVSADNSDIGTGTALINGLSLSGNTSGIVVNLTNDSEWDLDVTDNIAGPNDVFGIHVAADSGDQTLDITGNTASSNADTNILVEYSGTAGEAAGAAVHIDDNIVDGGLATTVNEGIRVDLTDAAHLAPSSIDGNTVTDNGSHNIAVFMTGTTSVDDLTIDGNVSTGAGLDGIHVETLSPVTLGGLSISQNLDIGNNGDDGIDVILTNFFGDPDISITDNLAVSNNTTRGIALSITDTVADAGAPSSSVGAIDISRNTVEDNLGGDGVEVTIDDQSGDGLLTVDSFTAFGNSVNRNAGGGVSLSATNATITDTTFESNGIEDNLGGDGVLLFGLNSLFDTVTFDANGIARNAGDGIDLDLDGSPINTLAIVNHQLGSSVNIGLDFLIDGNTFPGGVPSGAFTITNTSDPGFDVTSFLFDIGPSGNVYDTVGFSGFPFTPFAGTEVTTGVTTVNAIAVPPFGPPVPDASTLLDVAFADFNPGEAFQWDIDTDASPVTQDTITGDELADSTITVNFTTGLFLQGALFPVIGNPDASQFVSTFTNNTPGGIFENQGNGIRLSAVNGSDIGAMDISDNFITDNDLHGIEFIIDDSNLPDAAAPATITDNEITGHVNGDGIRMLLQETGDTDIGIDFIDNTITDNTGGIGVNLQIDDLPGTSATTNFTGNDISRNGQAGVQIELLQSADLTAGFDGNTISDNPDFGVHVIAGDNTNADLAFGQTVGGDPNVFDMNGTAGVGIEMSDSATGTFAFANSSITNTQATGLNPMFDGEGLRVVLDDSARLNSFVVGGTNPLVRDTFFNGNDASGVSLVLNQLSAVIDPVFQNSEMINNGGDGLQILRFADALIDNIVVDNNLINENDDNGVNFTFQGGNINIDTLGMLVIDADINDNQINQNDDSGVFISLDADVNTDFDIMVNEIDNSGDAGIAARLRFDSVMDGVWDDNVVTNSGRLTNSDGINVTLTERTLVGFGSGFTISNSLIADSDRDGIRFDTGNTVPAGLVFEVPAITANILDNGPQFAGDLRGITNNGGTGVNLLASSDSDITVVLDDNLISGNELDGLHADAGGTSDVIIDATGNAIEENLRHGVNLETTGAGIDPDLVATFTDNVIARNAERGVTLVNRGHGDATLSIIGTVDPTPAGVGATSRIEQNGEIGVYVENNAGAIDTNNDVSLTIFQTAVVGNGANTLAAADDRNGVFIRVGTSTDGAVTATVDQNYMSGNGNIDFVVESFTATPAPGVASQYTDAANHVLDPLARFGLIFSDNVGDSVDLTRFGATYNNADAFKSPGALYDSTSRLRNAQRLTRDFNLANDVVVDPPVPTATAFAGTGLNEGLMNNGVFTNLGVNVGVNPPRDITAYVAGTNVFTVAPALIGAPVALDVIDVFGDDIAGVGRSTFRTQFASVAAGGNVFGTVFTDFGDFVDLIDGPGGNPDDDNYTIGATPFDHEFEWSVDATPFGFDP